MELIEGDSMFKLIQKIKGGMIEVLMQDRYEILTKVAAGLKKLHNMEVIHRDRRIFTFSEKFIIYKSQLEMLWFQKTSKKSKLSISECQEKIIPMVGRRLTVKWL